MNKLSFRVEPEDGWISTGFICRQDDYPRCYRFVHYMQDRYWYVDSTSWYDTTDREWKRLPLNWVFAYV